MALALDTIDIEEQYGPLFRRVSKNQYRNVFKA